MGRERASILIIDDSKEMRQLLTAILGDEYRISAVADGESALAGLSSNRPDLILTDVMMGALDGFALCERIKAQDSLRDIPVIFISTLDRTEEKVRAFEAGGIDYVTKPIHAAEVRARVATHVKLRRLQTDLECRNEELRRNYDELKRLEKLKDDLTHMIIHDMRAPLAAVGMGLMLVAGKSASLDPPARDFLEQARTASRELSAMVNGLLDVVLLESGNMPLRRGRHDIKAIAGNAAGVLKSQADADGITVRVLGDASGAMVDEGLIQRVFENLIGNALKHSPRGGAVEVVTNAGADGVRAEVRDRGPGIPAEYREKIFEKFALATARADRQATSAGLGLAFCKLAVEAHGGRIGVDGAEGQGSAFWFELPAEPC